MDQQSCKFLRSSLQCLCPPYIYHLHRIHLAEKIWEVGIHNEVLAVESFSLPFASNVTWSYGMALLRYRGGVPHWMNAVHCISHMHSSSWSKASKFFWISTHPSFLYNTQKLKERMFLLWPILNNQKLMGKTSSTEAKEDWYKRKKERQAALW